ncbi:hypothetical protein [Qipengyuania sp.]|uniref:hypothetical protein n=1 Tax=Qipengyuania sp. TaxID=2004515 RepID=UPI003736D004
MAKRTDGLVAPVEHTVKDLLTMIDVGETWVAMPASTALALAIDRLTEKKVNIVIGLDPAGKPVGVIPRAQRRY